MNLSANELSALLSRTLESICRTHRDFDEAAGAITWLSQCGWDVIVQLVGDIDKLKSIDYRHVPKFENFADTTLVDLAGESLFTAGAMITDTGIARLLERGQCRMVLAAPLHPEAVLGYLSRYDNEHRAYVHACWTEPGKKFLARMDTVHKFADVWTRAEQPDERRPANAMMQILFSKEPPRDVESGNGLPELLELVGSTAGMVRAISSRDQANSYSASLDSGIFVLPDHYRMLEQIADSILVPTSNTSRRGAGD